MSSIKTEYLSALGDLRSGYSLRTKLDIKASLATHWLIPAKNIDESFDGIVQKSQLEPILFEGDDTKYIVNNGDVLISIRGKILAVFIKKTPEKTFASNNWAVFTPSKTINGQYFTWWFNHPYTQHYLLKDNHGSSLTFLSIKKLNDWRVPLPPIEVQEKLGKLYQLHNYQKHLLEELKEKQNAFFNAITYHKILGK